MKKHTGRRIKLYFGYSGMGRITHSDSYKRRAPFSRIKEIYGEELERFELETTTTIVRSKELLVKQKKEIRERVRKQLIKERKKNITIISFMFVFTVLFWFFINRYFSEIVEFLNV